MGTPHCARPCGSWKPRDSRPCLGGNMAAMIPPSKGPAQPPGGQYLPWCLPDLISEAVPLQATRRSDSAGRGRGDLYSCSNRGQALWGLWPPMAALGGQIVCEEWEPADPGGGAALVPVGGAWARREWAKKVARSGWVLEDQLAGKLNACVVNGVELKTTSLHTNVVQCCSLHLECCSTHSSSDAFSIP